MTNKGTREEPIIKARLVAQEFATKPSLEFFSGTPGLTAVKLILSVIATDPTNRALLIMDVTGAVLSWRDDPIGGGKIA